MYKVIAIKEYDMTRDVNLKSLTSGNIDECFDDSALVSDKCFDFMEVGKEYECKIMLFGNVSNNKMESSVLCKIENKDDIVGKRKMVKVMVDNDSYYIPQEKVRNFLNSTSFYFNCSRKDLIQVNNVIHADWL